VANWRQVLDEVASQDAALRAQGGSIDLVRRKYLAALAQRTRRNLIVYYSGWLQKEDFVRLSPGSFSLTDADKNGFMAAIHRMDRSRGLDLVLHTPGGDIAATESLVEYLRKMFGTDIRAIVPQLAMSAGTMMALACRQVLMGKHSSLGPVDPQIGNTPAHGVIEEFRKAAEEIKADPSRIPIWQPIFANYSPAFIGECQKAVDWANEMVTQWLITGMFDGDSEAKSKADKIVSDFGDHALTKSHARHISIDSAQKSGVNVVALEEDQDLQDAVLSLHHACIHTLAASSGAKLIENQDGVAFFQTIELQQSA